MDPKEKEELFGNLNIEGLTEDELERLAAGTRNSSHGLPCCSCYACSVGGDLRKWLRLADEREEAE
ncbi:MAG: hypothetical protein JO306_14810 [Gemmatimonadetes bacterium]|nr:hypothetical protein [Gemmatimonadota bacterium]